MKVGLIVLCRFGSSRLPGKILKDINGESILSLIHKRLAESQHAENIVVATSVDSSDDPIAEFCSNRGINCFRGSLSNVSDRFLQCSLANGFDYAVRINGDNVFTDPALIDEAVKIVMSNSYDFVSNVKGRTFPSGMSVEVIKTDFYKKECQAFSDYEQEHVTVKFYDEDFHDRVHWIYNEELAEAKGLKLALDTQEDFNLVSLLIGKMDRPIAEYSWKEIVQLALNEK